MEKLSVDFPYGGKIYSGDLYKISGAANGGMYHLRIRNHHQGQLWMTSRGWQFATQKGYHPELAKHLGNLVEKYNMGS